MARKVYEALAGYIQARENSNDIEWQGRHIETCHKLAADMLPSGGGFDIGSHIRMDECKPDRLVIVTSYHHMNDAGMYDGWTDHKVIVTPSLVHGFVLRITGRNRNDIKEYIADLFQQSLMADAPD